MGRVLRPGSQTPKPESIAHSSHKTAESSRREKSTWNGRGDSLSLRLEEITDRSVETDNFVQIELARVRPETPPFSPATRSKDATTSIAYNDLFVFDREVKSLLEILIGQSVQQALLEVSQEEEDRLKVEELRLHEEYRNVQRAEAQRQMALQLRYTQEERRRLEEGVIREEQAQRLAEKLEIAAYAKKYLENLMLSVYQRLQADGHFDKRVRQELELHFVPWMCEQVGTALDDLTAVSFATQVIVRRVLLEAKEEAKHHLEKARVPFHQTTGLSGGHPHKHNIAITLTVDFISQ
ncbi:putative Radial spoke head protein 3-like protein [Hypsibius exemplaris]|uniref:Radial spoke head protein 3-like protein n=1 Tax=Hypsibius exemplaris TaxID=2072580 RepID=A0A1W0WC28_HYPEX|nr:putative Radial spoke head protein 3-like protein [Hypsibius exemplaris]